MMIGRPWAGVRGRVTGGMFLLHVQPPNSNLNPS